MAAMKTGESDAIKAKQMEFGAIETGDETLLRRPCALFLNQGEGGETKQVSANRVARLRARTGLPNWHSDTAKTKGRPSGRPFEILKRRISR